MRLVDVEIELTRRPIRVVRLDVDLLSCSASAVCGGIPRLIAAVLAILPDDSLRASLHLFLEAQVMLSIALVVILDPPAEITQGLGFAGLEDDRGDIVPVILRFLHVSKHGLLWILARVRAFILIKLHVKLLLLSLLMKIDLLLLVGCELPDKVPLFVSFERHILRTHLIEFAVSLMAL